MTVTHKNKIIIYNVYEINLWPFTFDKDLALGNSLFGSVKLTANPGLDKDKYSDCGFGFDARGSFSIFDISGFGKKLQYLVLIWPQLFMLIVKKGILSFGNGPRQRLNSEINAAPLFLGVFQLIIWKKLGYKDMPMIFKSIMVDKYLMKKHDIKQCLDLFKKCLLDH